jgi:hypothetical protein
MIPFCVSPIRLVRSSFLSLPGTAGRKTRRHNIHIQTNASSFIRRGVFNLAVKVEVLRALREIQSSRMISHSSTFSNLQFPAARRGSRMNVNDELLRRNGIESSIFRFVFTRFTISRNTKIVAARTEKLQQCCNYRNIRGRQKTERNLLG